MKNLTVTGETIDGKSVIVGEDIFKLSDEMGFPLFMSIDLASQQNAVIDWIGYIDYAWIRGWLADRIWSTIKTSLEDCHLDIQAKCEIKNRCESYIFKRLVESEHE